LPEEAYGHINSAFCGGMALTVTAAHHFIWRYLYASMQAAQKPASKLRFVTPYKESSMNTMWQEEEFEQICSRESWTEKAAENEKTISVKEHEREIEKFIIRQPPMGEKDDYDSENSWISDGLPSSSEGNAPTMFHENRFWNWRPDGIVNNKNHRTLYILDLEFKFKRSCDRNEDFLRVKEDEANEQHKSILAAAPEWTFEHIDFVEGGHGAVVENDFYNNLERLNV